MAKKIWKIISWILFVLTILSIVPMLVPPSGANSASDPAAAQSFDSKLAQLADAHQRGESAEARLTESEVNSKVQQMFAGAPASGITTLDGVTVHLDQNELVAIMKIKVLALPLFITLGGGPGVHQGRLDFRVSEVKLGRMPMPASPISEALRQKLLTPEGQEMVTMPEYITGMGVENGELVIESK